MIETIIYESLEEWEADYKAEVTAQAQELNAALGWWCEPVYLFDRVGREDVLTGSTNLAGLVSDGLHYVQSPHVPPNLPVRDDMLLRLHNLKNVVKVLTQLSREHEFTWELIKPIGSIGERHLGYIERGSPSEPLADFMREVAQTYGLDLTAIDDDPAMKEMIDRYSQAREPAVLEHEHQGNPPATEDLPPEVWPDEKA